MKCETKNPFPGLPLDKSRFSGKFYYMFFDWASQIMVQGGVPMKRAALLFFTAFVLLALAGAVLAAEMTGEVTAVDAVKGSLTLTSGAVEAGFDCEAVSLIKDVKVGDRVTVQYKEQGGKKIATKVTPMKKKAPGY